MEKGSSDKKIKCINCEAEISEGMKFCSECGEPIKHKSSDDHYGQKKVCPKCYAEFTDDLESCTECGTKLEEVPDKSKYMICGKCFSEIPAGMEYCPVCGSKIDTETKETHVKSAKSSNISEELKRKRKANRKHVPKEGTHGAAGKSNKGLMKGLGGFIDKAASKIDENIQSRSDDDFDEKIYAELQKKKVRGKPGFLVCDKCGGYYELQPGESPEDFLDRCECGGRLIHKSDLTE